MGFSDFHGNADVIHRLRDMLARNRFPHAVILAGPAGSGKYTLSLMLAKAMNCLSPILTDDLPDFCSKCSNCVRIAQAEDFDTRFTEAIEAREALRETEKKETRLFELTYHQSKEVKQYHYNCTPPSSRQQTSELQRVNTSALHRARTFHFATATYASLHAMSFLRSPVRIKDHRELFTVTENYRAGEER